MASYLCVKMNSSATKSYNIKSSANKPYLRVDTGFIPLTTATATGPKLMVRAGGVNYRLADFITTTTVITTGTSYLTSAKTTSTSYVTGSRASTSGTGYQTRMSTSSTTYATRASTSATTYATRASTSATTYATRASTSATTYATRASTSATTYATRASTSNTGYVSGTKISSTGVNNSYKLITTDARSFFAAGISDFIAFSPNLNTTSAKEINITFKHSKGYFNFGFIDTYFYKYAQSAARYNIDAPLTNSKCKYGRISMAYGAIFCSFASVSDFANVLTSYSFNERFYSGQYQTMAMNIFAANTTYPAFLNKTSVHPYMTNRTYSDQVIITGYGAEIFTFYPDRGAKFTFNSRSDIGDNLHVMDYIPKGRKTTLSYPNDEWAVTMYANYLNSTYTHNKTANETLFTTGYTATTYATRASTSATGYKTRASTSKTGYNTRASTSATGYQTRASTSATGYQTRVSTSATGYQTRSSTSATTYATRSSQYTSNTSYLTQSETYQTSYITASTETTMEG